MEAGAAQWFERQTRNTKGRGFESRQAAGKYSLCGCIRASFSLEILQAGAVKGLKQVMVQQCMRFNSNHVSSDNLGKSLRYVANFSFLSK